MTARTVLSWVSLRGTSWYASAVLLSGIFLLALALPFLLSANAAEPLDEPFGEQATTVGLTNKIFSFGIVLIVLAAAIYIAIGAFMYFAASGNAELAKTGKDYISRAIMGLVLGLVAWVILQTISPQFAKELKDPKLDPVPAAPAPT